MSINVSNPLPVICQRIHAPGLDPIVAVWINDAPNSGTVILQCYDEAWTAGWSATGKHRIEVFFLSCDVPYLVGKLVGRRRVTKREEAYLARIVDAVQEALKAQRDAA